jgi:hypothetical protein
MLPQESTTAVLGNLVGESDRFSSADGESNQSTPHAPGVCARDGIEGFLLVKAQVQRAWRECRGKLWDRHCSGCHHIGNLHDR